MAIPTFTTKRLTLKPIDIRHADSYEKNFVDYEVVKMLAYGVPWPYPKGGVAEYIKARMIPNQGKDFWFWGIYLTENQEEQIGGVDLWRKGTPENRGFWLARRFWNQGLMTEAVEPVMNYAFEILGFEKLVFSNAVGNVGSRRVKEKTGARLVSTRPVKLVDPQYSEAENWELTKAEWKLHQTQKSSARKV